MFSNKKFQIFGQSFGIYQLAFYVLISIYAIVVVCTFTDYGITIDEPPHARYGRDIVIWYLSFFKEDAFLNAENMLFYGGLFDTIIHPITQISPLDIHDTRHLCNALVGLLGIISTYKLGVCLGTPATGLLAAIFLIFMPRYYGHAFNNPKDIPFAVGYIWSLYYLVKSLKELPLLSKNTLWKLAIAIGLTMAVRVGGAILLIYVGLFFCFRYVRVVLLQNKSELSENVWFRPFIMQTVTIGITSYLIMLLFWPRALIDPFVYPLHVLRVFSHFSYYVTTFFEGKEITWIEIPWYYVPKWMSMILPEFVFLGVLAGIIWLILHRRQLALNESFLQWSLVVFAALFPPVYVVIIHSPLGDALRHFLFIYPPIAIIAATGTEALVRHCQSPGLRWSFIGIMGLLILLTGWDMVRLHPNQYVYFNRLVAGGIQEASKNYQTDYWENSYKQGVRWLDRHYAFPQDRKLRLGAASDNVQFLLDEKYEFVVVPDPEQIDLYMSTTRANGHRMVPGQIIHTVDVDKVSLLYIIKPDSSFNNDPFFSDSIERLVQKAWRYDKDGKSENAVKAYKQLISMGQETSVIYNNLAENCIRLGNYQEGEFYAQKAISLDKENAKSHLRLGIALGFQAKISEAENAFQAALRLAPDQVIIYQNYGALLVAAKKWSETANLMKQAVFNNATDAQIWYMLAQAQRNLEQFEDAHANIKNTLVLSQETKYVAEYLNLGTTFYLSGQPDKARKIYEEVLNYAPDIPNVYINLGILNFSQQKNKDAIGNFLKATELSPNDFEAYLGLAQAYQKTGQNQQAIKAYQRVLDIDPKNQIAQTELKALSGL